MRLSKCVVLAFVAIALAPKSLAQSGFESDSLRAKAALESAKAELRKGKQLRAVEFAKEAHRFAPDWFEANFLLGLAYADAFQHAEAEPYLLRAVELDPTNVEARMKLAATSLKLGKPRQARDALEKSLALLNAAIAANPDSAEAIEALGLAHLVFGEWEEVEQAIQKLYALRSPLAFDLSKRIEALQAQAQEEIRFLKALHRARKKDAQVCRNVASAYLYLKDFPNAEEWLKKTLELKPDDANARQNLAMIYLRQKRYDDAIAAFRDAIRHSPSDSPELVGLFAGLGNAWLNVSALEKAIEAFETAIGYGNQVQPQPQTEMAYAHYGLGVALLRFERAIETKLLAKPSYQRLDALESPSLFEKPPRAKRYDAIVNAFKNAVARKPDFADAHMAMGMAYFGMGDARNAACAYREVIRLKPDDVEAYNALAIAYAEQGYYESAAQTLESAIKLKPDFLDARASLGRVYERQERWRDALAQYKLILELDENNADAHFRAGMIYARLKENFLASVHYGALKRLNPSLASRLYLAMQER
ncbi:MAG: tetratricopeptide repeat protein [Chloroherpetonaceae bacterium]|nr:tetratricopeptide repeat protein [Chloroherpetonaceae bacterium]MDW8438504.1 tetratricopeptide repeat protein [Chloroherpetonaceae bacterium]